LNFIGNVEGREPLQRRLRRGRLRRFVGTWCSRTAEGISKLILTQLQEEYASQGRWPSWGALEQAGLRGAERPHEPGQRPAAALLGVAGSSYHHGRANRVMIMKQPEVAAEMRAPGRPRQAEGSLQGTGVGGVDAPIASILATGVCPPTSSPTAPGKRNDTSDEWIRSRTA